MNIQEFKDNMGNVTFYDAVLLDGNGNAYMDMPTARLIWMANLRRVRNIKIKPLDVLSLRALEDGDYEALEAVIAQKVVLRNMPEVYSLDAAITWQDLLAMWPECLL